MSNGIKPARNTAATTGCLVLLVGFLIFALATCLMSDRGVRDGEREAEVKSSLHLIQLALEKYAEDHDGDYPPYLIGGEPKFAEKIVTGDEQNHFQNIQEIPFGQASDPLIREGYVDAYPRNPFIRNGLAIHQMQVNVPSAIEGSDPLRNGTEKGMLLGTRFGPFCNTMGNVLADPRFRERLVTDEDNPKTIKFPTYADVEYELWDVYLGYPPSPFLPGEFIYKSLDTFTDFPVGAMDSVEPSQDLCLNSPYGMGNASHYMLGVYGGIRNKGLDVLGEEQPVSCMLPDPHDPGRMTEHPLWLWTRSEISDDPTDREGSPFGVFQSGSREGEVTWGNPNGINDAIILVLTNGEDYVDREYIRDYGDMENATLNTGDEDETDEH